MPSLNATSCTNASFTPTQYTASRQEQRARQRQLNLQTVNLSALHSKQLPGSQVSCYWSVLWFNNDVLSALKHLYNGAHDCLFA